jgi:drug/metabolite transporter (DMT)-like permease
MSLGLSFFLQIAKRTAFAPSGSDVVFLLAFVPLFAVLLAWLVGLEKLDWRNLAGCITAILGTIVVVGNWEHPSSFSPFSLFVVEESLILVSALLFAMYAVLSKRMLERYRVNVLAILLLYIATCTVGAVSFALVGFGAITSITVDGWTMLASTGIFSVMLGVLSSLEMLSLQSIPRTATPLLLLPVLVTALIGIEKTFGFAYMATPYEWLPVIVGGLIVLSGIGLVWLRQPVVKYDERKELRKSHKTVMSIMLVLAFAGVAWAVIALFYPYKLTNVSGLTDSGKHYEARFAALRYNSAGGFMLLAAGITSVLTLVDIIRKRIRLDNALIYAIFSVLLVGAVFLVGDTPIINWSSDIPSDIQHGIGTPYVTLTDTAQLNVPWIVSVGFNLAYFILFSATYFLLWLRKKRNTDNLG